MKNLIKKTRIDGRKETVKSSLIPQTEPVPSKSAAGVTGWNNPLNADYSQGSVSKNEY